MNESTQNDNPVNPVQINVSYEEITLNDKPRFRYWRWGFVF